MLRRRLRRELDRRIKDAEYEEKFARRTNNSDNANYWRGKLVAYKEIREVV